MKVLVVIPAYNEEKIIGQVLQAVPPQLAVVVVDDGSSDSTAKIVRTQSTAQLLRHTINRGLGAALRTGFTFAIEQGYDAVVTLDADGQHNPQEIEKIIAGLSQADMVIGKRQDGQMPPMRRVYNKIAHWFMRSIFGANEVDTESGFRAFRVAALRQMKLISSRMEISSELVAEAHRLNLKIIEVPITVAYTPYSMSKGQGLREGIKTALRLLAHIFK